MKYMYYAVVPIAGVDGQISSIVPHIFAGYGEKEYLGVRVQIFNTDLDFDVSFVEW